MSADRPTYPLFGGTWSGDPELAAEQEALIELNRTARSWKCTRCGCLKMCRQAQRNAWLWRKAQDIERRRAAADETQETPKP